MHALFVTVSIDPATMDAAAEHLTSQVVPAVKQSPGFIAGYWFEPRDGGSGLEGFSVIVYDNEEHAKQAEQMAKNAPIAAGVSFTGFEIRKIIANG
jgi:hypothetical protein